MLHCYVSRQWHPTPALLPGKSHGWRSLVGCSPWGRYESDTTERLHFHFSLSCNWEENGNPLQCSSLENPRDRRAWWAAVYGCSDFGAQKNKVWHCFHCFPIYFPWSDGTKCMILVFWMLSFKPTFSLSSFTFIKRLFSSSSLSAIRVVSSAYQRLLILPYFLTDWISL